MNISFILHGVGYYIKLWDICSGVASDKVKVGCTWCDCLSVLLSFSLPDNWQLFYKLLYYLLVPYMWKCKRVSIKKEKRKSKFTLKNSSKYYIKILT